MGRVNSGSFLLPFEHALLFFHSVLEWHTRPSVIDSLTLDFSASRSMSKKITVHLNPQARVLCNSNIPWTKRYLLTSDFLLMNKHILYKLEWKALSVQDILSCAPSRNILCQSHINLKIGNQENEVWEICCFFFILNNYTQHFPLSCLPFIR